MRVRCTNNKIKSELIDEDLISAGYSHESTFFLTAGKEYNVYAVSIWRRSLAFLIEGDDKHPIWCPVDLFDLISKCIPDSWKFDVDLSSGSDLKAILGYSEIVLSKSHYDGLIEENTQDIETFRKQSLVV